MKQHSQLPTDQDAWSTPSKRLLTKPQCKQLLRVIQTKTPNDWAPSYHSDAWTTEILGDYIKDVYQVEYDSKTDYFLLFRRAKLVYPNTGHGSKQQFEQEVTVWRDMARAQIATVWHDPDTVILAADELTLATHFTFQQIWLRPGGEPQIEVSHSQEKQYIYGFLNVKTGREHAFKTTRRTSSQTAAILEQLRRRYPTQSLLLLWDRAWWHGGSRLNRWIQQDGQIQLLSFPTSAAVDNPQAQVFEAGLQHVTPLNLLPEIDTVMDRLVAYLNTTRFPVHTLFSARL